MRAFMKRSRENSREWPGITQQLMASSLSLPFERVLTTPSMKEAKMLVRPSETWDGHTVSLADIEKALAKQQRRSTYTIPWEQQTSIQRPHTQLKPHVGSTRFEATASFLPDFAWAAVSGSQFVSP